MQILIQNAKKNLERKLVQISKKLREIHSAKAYVSSTPVKGTKWESVSGKRQTNKNYRAKWGSIYSDISDDV